MSKYIALLIIFFSSCYTSKNAEKDIEKAHQKFPELVAKKSSEWFPCGWQVIRLDEKDKHLADSLFNSFNENVIIISDTIEKIIRNTDTIIECNQIKDIRKQLLNAKTLINVLQNNLRKQPPYVYRTIQIQDSAKVYYLQSELNASKIDYKKYRDKYEQLLKISIWLIIALGLSLFFNFYKK